MTDNARVIFFDTAAVQIHFHNIAENLVTLHELLNRLTEKMLDGISQLSPDATYDTLKMLSENLAPIGDIMRRQQQIKEILERGSLEEMISLRNSLQYKMSTRSTLVSGDTVGEVILLAQSLKKAGK